MNKESEITLMKKMMYGDPFFKDLKNGFVSCASDFSNNCDMPKDISYIIDDYVNNDAHRLWNYSILIVNDILSRILNILNVDKEVYMIYYKQIYKMLNDKIGSNYSTMFSNLYYFKDNQSSENNKITVINVSNYINNLSIMIVNHIVKNDFHYSSETNCYHILLGYFAETFNSRGMYLENPGDLIHTKKYATVIPLEYFYLKEQKLNNTTDPLKRNKIIAKRDHTNEYLDRILYMMLLTINEQVNI